MQIIRAYFTLIRFHNCLVALLAVAAGQYLTPMVGEFKLNPYAMAAAFFVCGFGNIVNDLNDIDADRINHPQRALPSGAISTARAKILAFLFLLVSIVLLLVLNALGCLIVVVSICLVLWYNLRLKHTAYWGNLIVSLLGVLTFLLGGATYGIDAMLSLPGAVIPAAFALLMHFGREIIKDIEDSAGDAATGIRTAPVRAGVTGPLILTGCVFIALIAGSLVVFLLDWFDRTYFYMVLIGIYLPLIGGFFWLFVNPHRGRCRVVSATLKAQMIVGLVALVFGRNY